MVGSAMLTEEPMKGVRKEVRVVTSRAEVLLIVALMGTLRFES
jgi:hypothetical protein